LQKEPTNAYWSNGHGIHLRAQLAKLFRNASQEAIVRKQHRLLLRSEPAADVQQEN